MTALLKELTGDPVSTAANYANASYEGTVGHRTDSPNGELYIVHAATWIRLLRSNESLAGSVTLTGDVTGPASSNVVVSLTGNGGLLTVIAPTMAWAGNVTTPTIRQQPPAGAGNGQPLTVVSQVGGTGTTTGGALNLGTGAGNAGGLSGAVNIQWAGVTQFSFDPVFSGMLLSQPNITWASTAAAPVIQQGALAATNGKDFTISAQSGGGGTATTGGSWKIASGAGNAGGAPGTIQLIIGGVASTELVQVARTGGIVFSPAFPTPTIQHQSTSGAAVNMIISAQTTSLALAQGAHLQLRSGGGPGGSGMIQLFLGANADPSFNLTVQGAWNIRSGATAAAHLFFVDWENVNVVPSVAGDPIGIPVEVDGNEYILPLYPQF